MYRSILNGIISRRNKFLNNLEKKIAEVPGSIQSSITSKPKNPTAKSFFKMHSFKDTIRLFLEAFPKALRSRSGEVYAVANAAKNPSFLPTEVDNYLINKMVVGFILVVVLSV